MSFKYKVQISAMMLMLFSLLGCSEFLNGKKSAPEVIEFADTRFACLQKVPNQIRKFSVGEAEESEIRGGFDCVTEALRYFNKRTFGSAQEGYTSEEMRKFFGKYFLKENNVSPEFAAELMKLKRALLGGAASSITKEEIVQMIDVLNILRDEFIRLAPHMKVLLQQGRDEVVDWDKVTTATEQLRKSLQRLLDNSQIAESDYGFTDVKLALTGFAEFVRGTQPFAPYDRYSKWLPAVEAVKNALMGKRAHFVDLYEWKESLNSLVDLYELTLRYHYSLRDLNFANANANKVRQASQFVSQSLNLILNSHQMKTKGLIPTEDIDLLIATLLPISKVPVTEAALKTSYRSLLQKMLNPDRSQRENNVLQGLEKKHLIALQREFNIWRLQQSFVDSIASSDAGTKVTQSELLEHYKKFDKDFVIERGLSEDPFDQQELRLAWADFGDLLLKPVPTIFDDQGLLLIAPHLELVPQKWSSLTRFNFMRALSRMLMVGYADNLRGGLKSAGMTQQGLISWYDDFQKIGLELKAFDPRSANSGARSFMEANFFTLSGNGDDLMDHRETFEFVSSLFSAGLASSEAIRQDMVSHGCAVAEKDAFGFAYLEQNCFQRRLRQQWSEYFKNMPGMSAYVSSLKMTQWDQFFAYLVSAGAVDKQKSGFIETANLRTIVMILHYIETLMILNDHDRSQGLSLKEVYAAAPRFMSFMKSLKKLNNETLLREGFAHLVFTGSIPDLVDLVSFQLSKVTGLKEAQRMEMVRLFGSLKNQMTQDSP